MTDAPAETPAQRAQRQTLRDRRLASLAARQLGLVTRAQLGSLGFSAGCIDRLIARGRLHRMYRAVYAVGHPVLSTEARLLAATLATGRGTFVSFRSAGQLLGIRDSLRVSIDVSTSARGRRPTAGIELHHARWLPDRDVTIVRAVPVTCVSRTVADLAGIVSRGDLERTVERAERTGRLDVAHALDAVRNRAGAALLRDVLGATSRAPTRSELEDRLLALVIGAEVEQPEISVRLAGFEVDFLWRRQRLVVEVDGHAFHATRSAIERDRRRDAVLARHGFRVLRFTWRQVTTRPAEVVAAIRAALYEAGAADR